MVLTGIIQTQETYAENYQEEMMGVCRAVEEYLNPLGVEVLDIQSQVSMNKRMYYPEGYILMQVSVNNNKAIVRARDTLWRPVYKDLERRWTTETKWTVVAGIYLAQDFTLEKLVENLNYKE